MLFGLVFWRNANFHPARVLSSFIPVSFCLLRRHGVTCGYVTHLFERDHFLFGIHLCRPECCVWLCYYWLNDGLLCPAEPDVCALESGGRDRGPAVGGIGGYNRIMAKCIQLCIRRLLKQCNTAQVATT